MDKIIIKNSIKDILIYYGITPGKTELQNWTCRADRHNSPINSLSLKGTICCCSCGIMGDSFSVIAEFENLDLKKDFNKILDKAKNILNINNSDSCVRGATTIIKKLETNNENNLKYTIKYNLTDCIIKAIKKQRLKDYGYYFNRGITNIKILSKYRILSCNPQKVIPKELLPKLSNIWAYTNIIPVWKEQKVVNCILRRNDNLSTSNNKVYNLKGLPLEIFNLGYLNRLDPNDTIFITEGIFDCLSLENYGMKSICLNSVTMYRRLLDSVKVNRTYLIDNNIKFGIFLDNDDVGKRYSKLIKDELNTLGIKNNSLYLRKYKDINEFLIHDKSLFKESLKNIKKVVDNN